MYLKKTKEPIQRMTTLKIVNSECYKCEKPVIVAFAIQSQSIIDVSDFTDELIKTTRDCGVKIENRYSKTLEKAYNANVCPHCDAFFGQMFTYRFIYSEVVKELVVDNSLVVSQYPQGEEQ